MAGRQRSRVCTVCPQIVRVSGRACVPGVHGWMSMEMFLQRNAKPSRAACHEDDARGDVFMYMPKQA